MCCGSKAAAAAAAAAAAGHRSADMGSGNLGAVEVDGGDGDRPSVIDTSRPR